MNRMLNWLAARKYTLLATLSLSVILALQACGGSSNYQSHGTKGSGNITTNQDAKFTGKIIFVKNRNIFVLDGKTNQLTQLTSGNNTLQPSLSRDGKTLALEVRQPGNFYSDIAMMPFQSGGNPTMLTDDSLHNLSDGVPHHYEFWANNPIWTADGQNLIFLSDFFKGEYTTPRFSNPTCTQSQTDWILDMGIVQMPASAQPAPALAANGRANAPKQLAWPYCYAGGDQNLSLRPGVSDTEILFTSFQYNGAQLDLTAQLELLILSPDGNNHLIQLSAPDPNAIPMEPSWSPDGKYITYIRRENSEDNLYIMPVPDTTITGTPNNETYGLESGGKDTYYTNTTYYSQSQQLATGIYGNPVWGDSTHIVVMKFDTTDNGGAFNLFLATLKFATPAANPTGTPTATATAAPASASVSITGNPIQLTQGGVDGESAPIWTGA
jgi:hypothetical protein